jgi:hypothetical protein
MYCQSGLRQAPRHIVKIIIAQRRLFAIKSTPPTARMLRTVSVRRLQKIFAGISDAKAIHVISPDEAVGPVTPKLTTAARRQFERLTLQKEEAVPMSTALTVAELARYQISEMRFGLPEVSDALRISKGRRSRSILNRLPKGPKVRAH